MRDLDHPSTLRQYCLARLEERLGEIRERKAACRKVNCTRHRLAGSTYCLEHLIAEQFGRHLARLGGSDETPPPEKTKAREEA
ncbi:MAG: hypothetical protein JXP73_21050 [Deltaproteobacteria bacterium]|nr:hypothetical protein [Deltaproteobacteria bacterium]